MDKPLLAYGVANFYFSTYFSLLEELMEKLVQTNTCQSETKGKTRLIYPIYGIHPTIFCSPVHVDLLFLL